MWALLEAQLANNVQAQRYADILAVINDNKISSIEVDALALKWGKSTSFVLDYISKVTGINTIVVDKDFGADAATGWDKARLSLSKYLAELNAGNAAQIAIVETDLATQAADEAIKAAEEASKAADKAIADVDKLLASLGIKPDALGGSMTDSAASRSFAPTSSSISGLTPTSQYGAQTLTPGSGGYNASTINVTLNTGNLIGGKEELVATVREGILAGQTSGNKILLNALEL